MTTLYIITLNNLKKIISKAVMICRWKMRDREMKKIIIES